jgi:hypothetical protein
VSVTWLVLGFSAQAFNAWKKSPVRDWDEARLINAAMVTWRAERSPCNVSYIYL